MGCGWPERSCAPWDREVRKVALVTNTLLDAQAKSVTVDPDKLAPDMLWTSRAHISLAVENVNVLYLTSTSHFCRLLAPVPQAPIVQQYCICFKLRPDAFKLRPGAFKLSPGARHSSFRLSLGAFKLRPGALRLSLGAFKLRPGAFSLSLGAFRLSLGAFRLSLGAFRLSPALRLSPGAFGLTSVAPAISVRTTSSCPCSAACISGVRFSVHITVKMRRTHGPSVIAEGVALFDCFFAWFDPIYESKPPAGTGSALRSNIEQNKTKISHEQRCRDWRGHCFAMA